MKLYRFVGENEVNKLLNNETIQNDRDWSKYYDTNSKGICFFTYNRTNNINKVISTVLEGWGFAGIVKQYALVEIEIDTARKAYGNYSGGCKTEYNLNQYNIKNVKAIYTINRNVWTDGHGNYFLYQGNKIF